MIKIDWNSFYANGGYSNNNSDPASYIEEIQEYNYDDYDFVDRI